MTELETRKQLLYKLELENEIREEKPLIEVNDLSINFKRSGKLFEAVKAANLKIEKNEILGVVGESGSGKTTLGRSILGLWDHAKGEVLIDGRVVPNKKINSVTKKNIWVYEKGQMIFQDPTSSLNRQKKVLDIITEGLNNFDIIKKEYRNELQGLNEKIEAIDNEIKKHEDHDYLKEILTIEKENNFFSKVILNSKKKEFKEFLKDYSNYLELSNKKDLLKLQYEKIENNYDSETKINKLRIKSSKLEIIEDLKKDTKFFKDFKDVQKKELKILNEKFISNEEKTVLQINKRINKFLSYILKKTEHLSDYAKGKVDIIFKTFANQNDLKNSIEFIENFVVDEKFNLNQSDINVLENIKLNFEIVILKLDNFISGYNTREFDEIYWIIDDIISKKVTYYLELVKDLDIRLTKEKENLNNSISEYDKNYFELAVKYLEEYKTILEEVIDEYRYVRRKTKKILINNIDTFLEEILKINKRMNTLQLSIATWKNSEMFDYLLRRKEKTLKEITEEISKISSVEIPILEQYNSFSDIRLVIKDIFMDEWKKHKTLKIDVKEHLISEAEYKKLISEKEQLIQRKNNISNLLKDKKTLKEESLKRAKEILSLVGLGEDALNKYPDQFSGGQKQRIGIARTIITNPKFVVADEPISALDVSVQAQVINLLKELHQKLGLTMMFIAHDLEMVHYISTKIAVIYRGNIVEYGDADKVYKNPKHPYTKSLINAMPSLNEIGKKLEISDYSWASHRYNEFSHPIMREIEKDHFVFCTETEFKKWS